MGRLATLRRSKHQSVCQARKRVSCDARYVLLWALSTFVSALKHGVGVDVDGLQGAMSHDEDR